MRSEETLGESKTPSLKLEIINNVKFSRREIDVIACVIAGRGSKTIASLLTIAPKTVDAHIHNIMGKITCSSREDIINFIEKSDKYLFLRRIYQDLLLKSDFRKTLIAISTLLRNKMLPQVIIYQYELSESEIIFTYNLEEHFKLIGIPNINRIEKDSFFPLKWDDINCHIIHIVSEELTKKLQENIIEESTIQYKFIDVILQNPTNHTLLLLDKNISILPQEFLRIDYVSFKAQNSHYLVVLEVLRRIIGKVNIDLIISNFKKNLSLVSEKPEKLFSNKVSSAEEFVVRKNIFPPIKKIFIENKISILISCIIFSIVTLISYYNFQKDKKHTIISQYIIPSFRSDLIIPNSIFIDRPKLVSAIEEKFKDNQGIYAVAIIGVGGSGKSTIAKYYAHQQHATVVWEMNAGNKESLLHSFEVLAHKIANETEKKIVRDIKNIRNFQEREDNIIAFIQDKLRIHTNWFLIYDNVENFKDIQKYFPCDFTVWGKGRILVTTKDNNIQNNSYINNSILIEELEDKEKLQLFLKILNKGNTHKFTELENKQAKEFLLNIPSFPLDVSIAAYYLKATNISYKKYIERLNQPDQNFVKAQEDILKEAGEYIQTRYNLITLSLKQFIKINKNFKNLLLFVSLLNSQNIPRALLDEYIDERIVDNFIYHLKRYSLITNKKTDSFFHSLISLHHTTQKISLTYLIKDLDLKNNHQPLEQISDALEKTITNSINKEDFSYMRLLLTHAQSFLSHNNILTFKINSTIGVGIGCIYYYLGEDLKTKEIIEHNIMNLNKYYSKDYIGIGQALTHLGNVYRRLGKYEQAKDLLQQSLIIYKKYSGAYIGTARTLGDLGIVYRHLDNYDKANNSLQESLRIYKQNDKMHVGAARVLVYQGIISREKGNYKEAKNLFTESIKIYKNHPEHEKGLTWALIHLGNIYIDLGNYEIARNILEQGLIRVEKPYSKYYTDISWGVVRLGYNYRKLGNYMQAQKLLEQSVALYKKHYFEEHVDVGWGLIHLGNVYRERGEYNKAKNLLEQGLSIYTKYFQKENAHMIWGLASLGNLYREQGDYENAQKLFTNTLIVYKKLFGEDSLKSIWILIKLGCLNNDIGNYIIAREMLEKSWTIYNNYYDKDNPKIVQLTLYLGNLYKNLGEYKKAKEFLEQSYIGYKKLYGDDHIRTARVLNFLAEVYMKENKLESAEEMLCESLKILKKHQHPDSYLPLENLADLYLTKYMHTKTISSEQHEHLKSQSNNYLLQALEIIKLNFPLNSIHLKRIQYKLQNTN
ncbi:MAG: tetratricopeptide repeat protein [Rickettsia endosymbiont of Platyusa sonomae]|nr:tetratricopeptide repeat protein [Rickettsia endosymbiont of Platyusa sonomae]